MTPLQYFLLVAVAFATAFLTWRLRRYLRDRKRAQLYATPLPEQWLALLEEHVPLASKIPEALTPIYHGHINYFLATKVFVGRGGFEVNDRVRLTIAGNACLLVLTRSEPIYPGFETILVYPDSYHAPTTDADAAGGTQTHYEHRSGESWYRGPIVLAWNYVAYGSGNPEDAHNVVIHEFAHKLDEENQIMDGLPILREPAHYREWAQVLSREYEAFLDRVDAHHNTVIDSYGAESPVEFFAVITESFFEKPRQMKEKLPALYEQLCGYYGVDVAEW